MTTKQQHADMARIAKALGADGIELTMVEEPDLMTSIKRREKRDARLLQDLRAIVRKLNEAIERRLE